MYRPTGMQTSDKGDKVLELREKKINSTTDAKFSYWHDSNKNDSITILYMYNVP